MWKAFLPFASIVGCFRADAFICLEADVGLGVFPVEGAEFGDFFGPFYLSRFTQAFIILGGAEHLLGGERKFRGGDLARQ